MDNLINTPYSRESDRYYDLEKIIKENFKDISSKNVPLFLTNAEDLWDIYLENIEAEDARQHYTCNACKSFINKYGSLVTINEDGELESALWNIDVPPFFRKSIKALNKAVSESRIKNIFISDVRKLGIRKTGEWTHISVELPKSKINTSRLLNAYQIMASKKEDYRTLSRALQEYSTDTITQAIYLLKTENLYRGNKYLEMAVWLSDLKLLLSGEYNSKQIENIKWLNVALAPNGFCHIKSSVFGTLLDDIEDNLDYSSIKRRFEERMNPYNYMRSQSAPTDNAVNEAEKIVERLGIADSLARRYAQIEEIPEFIWRNKSKNTTKDNNKGIFANIQTRNKTTQKNNNLNLPTTVMTWEKFARTILPTADRIEAKVENTNRLMALVTATNKDSENIFKWDNRFSWYYHGGIDGEIKKRVEEAGGRYENNEIRCSLIWEGRTDLDLHCITPNGDHIYFSSKRGRCEGWLDLDMNGLDEPSDTPVENMRWTTNAPLGNYTFYVHNYNERVNGYRGTAFKVELEINGTVYNYYGNPLRHGEKTKVFEFNYSRDKTVDIAGNASNSSTNNWNVNIGDFIKVNGIAKSPDLWGDNESYGNGHIFFLLDGCKDLSEGKGRGFFNEMLKPELRQIRKTLEAYTAATPIDYAEDATACGLGYNSENEWNLILKVISGNSERIIKIDRID